MALAQLHGPQNSHITRLTTSRAGFGTFGCFYETSLLH